MCVAKAKGPSRCFSAERMMGGFVVRSGDGFLDDKAIAETEAVAIRRFTEWLRGLPFGALDEEPSAPGIDYEAKMIRAAHQVAALRRAMATSRMERTRAVEWGMEGMGMQRIEFSFKIANVVDVRKREEGDYEARITSADGEPEIVVQAADEAKASRAAQVAALRRAADNLEKTGKL